MARRMAAPPLGIEAKLWAMADALRNNMDAAEYKHVVLGPIFLKLHFLRITRGTDLPYRY